MANKANAPNWKKIKAEYIKGGISQQKLADKYGIPYGTLHRRVLLEGWSEKRRACKELVDQKLTEKLADQQVELMAQIALLRDRAGLEAFQKVLKQIQDFPESDGATKVTREIVEAKTAQSDDGEASRIPLRSSIESSFVDSVRSLTALSRDFGLDAASKLARQKLQNEQRSNAAEDGALPRIIITGDGGIEVHE